MALIGGSNATREVKPGVYALVLFVGAMLIFAVIHFQVEVKA